jgi:hypothetical protein
VPEKPNRLPSILLAIGAAVLLGAILLGERMGDKVMGQVASGPGMEPLVNVSAEPLASSGPFGPDWKRSETLTAAPDPRFPDPRVPPMPLPTPEPQPTVNVHRTPTPNPNIPIWRQQPLPTVAPVLIPTSAPVSSPSPTP